jgi:hypothetical protein
MSMSLFIWKSPVVDDDEDARALVDRYYESGDAEVFAPSEDVERFYDDLLARYPTLETYSEEELRAGTRSWAESPERSDRVIALEIVWSAEDELFEAIDELARKYDLVLYDPQGPSVGVAPAEGEELVPTADDFVRTAVAAVISVGVAVGAWFASIPVLSWALIAFAGFMAVIFVLALKDMAGQARKSRRAG